MYTTLQDAAMLNLAVNSHARHAILNSVQHKIAHTQEHVLLTSA